MNKLKYWIKDYFYMNFTDYDKVTLRSLFTGMFVTILLAFISIVILLVLGSGYVVAYHMITDPGRLRDGFEIFVVVSGVATVFIGVVLYNEYLADWASKFLDKRIATYNRPERNKEE